MEQFQIPVMEDALKSSITAFHTTKITVSDPTKFTFVSSIPESMYRCVTAENNVMADYRKLTPTGPRKLTPEMQSALEVVDKPTKRRKKPDQKKKDAEGQSSQVTSPKKRKAKKGPSSVHKKRKIKKMAKKLKAASSSDSIMFRWIKIKLKAKMFILKPHQEEIHPLVPQLMR